MKPELTYHGSKHGFTGWKLECLNDRKQNYKPVEMSYNDRENLKQLARVLQRTGNVNALADMLTMIAHWQRNPGVSFADYAPQWVASQTSRTDWAKADDALKEFYPLVGVPQLIKTGFTDWGFAENEIRQAKLEAKQRAERITANEP